jgi:hypothetical protein
MQVLHRKCGEHTVLEMHGGPCQHNADVMYVKHANGTPKGQHAAAGSSGAGF